MIDEDIHVVEDAEIIDDMGDVISLGQINPNPQTRHKRWWEKQSQLRLQGSHSPRFTLGSIANEESGKPKDIRKKCKLCSRKISSKCFECGVYLCFGSENAIGCWDVFHNCENFPKKRK